MQTQRPRIGLFTAGICLTKCLLVPTDSLDIKANLGTRRAISTPDRLDVLTSGSKQRRQLFFLHSCSFNTNTTLEDPKSHFLGHLINRNYQRPRLEFIFTAGTHYFRRLLLHTQLNSSY